MILFAFKLQRYYPFVGKLYSSILSNRIVSYSNICNILIDEQKMDFVKTDHVRTIYLLCQVLFKKDYMNPHKPTFAAFLDMESFQPCE